LEYGYLLKINDQGMTLFDISDNLCIKKPISSHEIAAELTHYKKLNETTMEVSPIKGARRYTFQRLSNNAVDKCNKVLDKSPIATFKTFANLMKKHYAFFDLYHINWDALVKQHRANINQDTSDAFLYNTLSSMLVDINDAHLNLQAELKGTIKVYRNGKSRYLRPALDKAFQNQTQFDNAKKFRANWYQTYKSNIKNQLLSQQNNNDFDELIIWGSIGDVGYINILRMIGFSETGSTKDEVEQAKLAMDHVMSKLKNSSAIIVDITANGGGEDEVSRMFASYFTKQPVLAYKKQIYSSDLPQQSFYIKPAKNHQFLGPTFLVTSDHSVSAAEIFTLAMRSIKNVTHLGETTRGALSDILDKELPNGWRLGLSNEIYFDSTGKSWESKGIPPQKQIDIFRGKKINTSHLQSMKLITNFVNNDLQKSSN
jgi:carboxyl-terminal processing protease